MKFQERKCNIVSEFACIASYEIIEKHLLFLKPNNVSFREEELQQAIIHYIETIVGLLKGEWLFFQAQTLNLFNDILQRKESS